MLPTSVGPGAGEGANTRGGPTSTMDNALTVSEHRVCTLCLVAQYAVKKVSAGVAEIPVCGNKWRGFCAGAAIIGDSWSSSEGKDGGGEEHCTSQSYKRHVCFRQAVYIMWCYKHQAGAGAYMLTQGCWEAFLWCRPGLTRRICGDRSARSAMPYSRS